MDSNINNNNLNNNNNDSPAILNSVYSMNPSCSASTSTSKRSTTIDSTFQLQMIDKSLTASASTTALLPNKYSSSNHNNNDNNKKSINTETAKCDSRTYESTSSSSSSMNSVNYFQTLKSVCKSGIITVYFLTTKYKKTYYAQLNDRTFEMHDSQKAQRKRKNAKYIVDLSTCFNVSLQNFSRFRTCVSLMTPDETLFFKGKKDSDIDEWYQMTLSAVIPARALRLGRPVFHTEFFECAWDVVLKTNPKLRNPRADSENLPNICVKRPELATERQRLCVYPHSILLCRFGIEARSDEGTGISRIPPFKMNDYIEFPRSYVKNFGVQDKYFFMRIGRLSDIGACEVWMQSTAPVCESEEGAIEIYTKLKSIIDRENEKQRDGIIPLFGDNNQLTTAKSLHTMSNNSRCHLPHSKSTLSSKDLSASRQSRINNNDESRLLMSASTSMPRLNDGNNKCANLMTLSASSSSATMKPVAATRTTITETEAVTQFKDNVGNNAINTSGSRADHLHSHASTSSLSSGYYENHKINNKSNTNRCEKCGIEFSNNSKEFDELCCEYYVKARAFWEQPSSGGADEETEDSGGTLRLNYIPNSNHTCNSCSVNSLNNTTKGDDDDDISVAVNEHLENYCENCQHEVDSNDGGNDSNNIDKVKVFVECHTIDDHKAKKNDYCILGRQDNTKAGPINCCNCIGYSCDVEAGERKNSPISCGNSVSNAKMRSISSTTNVLASSSMSLNEESMRDQTETPFLGDAASTAAECSSENMSTSSLISTGGQLSCSFSTDGGSGTGSGIDYCLCSAPCTFQQQTNRTNFFTHTVPFHPKTMSCSSGCGANNSTIAETAAARAALYKAQHHRSVIAEKCNGVAELRHENTANQPASCSSTGSASYLAVPSYENTVVTCASTEETCSYASDSGDSCYSSMANGNLNTRAFSFSSDAPQNFSRHNQPCKWCSGCSSTSDSSSCSNGVSHHNHCYHQHHQHHHLNNHQQHRSVLPPSASDDSGAITSLSTGFNSENNSEKEAAPQIAENIKRIAEQEHESTTESVVTTATRHPLAEMDEIEHLGTTLISKSEILETNRSSRRRHTNRASPKIPTAIEQNFFLQPNSSVEELRGRTFSLGSASWITKRFRKLSFNNNANRMRNSASKSGLSLAASVIHDPNNTSLESIKIFSGSRQPSSCSFASSSVGTQSLRYTRSDSIGSSQSFFNQNGASTTSTTRNETLPSSSASFSINNRCYSGRRKYEKTMPPASNDLVEFECGRMYGPNSSSSTDQLMLVESPSLTIFSSSIHQFENGEDNTAGVINLHLEAMEDRHHKISKGSNGRCAASPSPSLSTSASLKIRDIDSASTRGSFCATPSISATTMGSLTGFSISSINNNKYSSEDYADDNELEMAVVYRPEKPKSISRKLREVPCFMSQDDQAKLDELTMMLNEKTFNKSASKTSECSNSIVFETINENASDSSRSSKNHSDSSFSPTTENNKINSTTTPPTTELTANNLTTTSSDYVLVTCFTSHSAENALRETN